MYDNCDGDRDVELVDPTPVLNLKRKEGKRPAILIGLRDNENDSGVIKVGSFARCRASPDYSQSQHVFTP